MEYEVIDYNENVKIQEIASLILAGYEVEEYTDDWDLNYSVYIKK